MRVAVVGAGSWGTALAMHLARAGCAVALWAREAEVVAGIRRTRRNPLFLSEFAIPERVRGHGRAGGRGRRGAGRSCSWSRCSSRAACCASCARTCAAARCWSRPARGSRWRAWRAWTSWCAPSSGCRRGRSWRSRGRRSPARWRRGCRPPAVLAGTDAAARLRDAASGVLRPARSASTPPADVVGRRAGRGAQERHRDRGRHGHRPRARPQRAGGAADPRAARDRAPGRPARRPRGDVPRPRGDGRPGADVHRGALAQPQRRRAPRTRRAARPTSSPAARSPRACPTARAAAELARRHGVEMPITFTVEAILDGAIEPKRRWPG